MTWQFILRFVVGGLVVSAFAVLGDMLKPKSFAGLFGAAPSVSLATLALTLETTGVQYAARECRSMMVGAGAFLIYTWVCTRVLLKFKFSAMSVTLVGIVIWLACTLPVWFVLR